MFQACLRVYFKQLKDLKADLSAAQLVPFLTNCWRTKMEQPGLQRLQREAAILGPISPWPQMTKSPPQFLEEMTLRFHDFSWLVMSFHSITREQLQHSHRIEERALGHRKWWKTHMCRAARITNWDSERSEEWDDWDGWNSQLDGKDGKGTKALQGG